jgi:N-sulfoglucosamine sulfohydrolase
MMWPGLVQPRTMPVTFILSDNKIKLSSATEGASIAYQVEGIDGADTWRLYNEPLDASQPGVIRARAVRIGYKTSEITLY